MFMSYSNFNPRSREGSDDDCLYACGSVVLFQSTLPRRERQASLSIGADSSGISIHAPAKGATRCKPCAYIWGKTISIHAPAKGATRSTGSSAAERRFQSTLPRRERPSTGRRLITHNTISIHAPAKGATVIINLSLTLSLYFNPRSREGSDPFQYLTVPKLSLFQSTLPRRERQGRTLPPREEK